jgi:hypothetical protein
VEPAEASPGSPRFRTRSSTGCLSVTGLPGCVRIRRKAGAVAWSTVGGVPAIARGFDGRKQESMELRHLVELEARIPRDDLFRLDTQRTELTNIRRTPEAGIPIAVDPVVSAANRVPLSQRRLARPHDQICFSVRPQHGFRTSVRVRCTVSMSAAEGG